ncbi:MAG: glycoside hydrolase 43 family protein [Bacteroidales bacterium]|nr:glycoside hydrolase 43 family protein [Bacteroidales bacterium]
MMRVGDSYYMSSTTMHMNPGVPIMKSNDLSNWKIVGYAYDKLGDIEQTMLLNGKNTYGKGSWASCIRYVNNKFFVSTFDQVTAKTYFFTTDNIESGKWERHEFEPSLHDHTVVFEEDGHVYMINGNGKIFIREIEPDFSGVKPNTEKVLIENAGLPAGEDLMLGAEGSQMFKINGKYYLFNICWPRGGMRTVICHKSDNLFGPYEGKVVFQDQGVAQGGLIDTPDGQWFAYLFGDRGAVGRIPYIVPVVWENEWPVLGVDGKVPDTLNLPKSTGLIPGIVDSDDFDNQQPKLVWQWNHNPVNELWSLTERPGFLRLKTDRIDTLFTQSRNMLTQRTFGPQCSGSISLDVTNLKDGDIAGLALLAGQFGYVGVKCDGDKKSIVMVDNQFEGEPDPNRPFGMPKGVPHEVETVPFDGATVFFKADCNFENRVDTAYFQYSLDGKEWKNIGHTLQMRYNLDHFMGQRYALFNYSTKQPGGYADFDWYKVSYK